MTKYKALIPFGIVVWLFCNSVAMADAPAAPAASAKPAASAAVATPAASAKPAASAAVATPAAPAVRDAVSDAETQIDNATSDIDKDTAKSINWLVELAKSGRWGPFAGQLILFIVWGIRKFAWKLIKPTALPYVTLGFAMATSVAVGFIAGNAWWKVLIDGLITGGAAMGLWSLLFKHLLKTEEKEKTAEGTTEAKA